MSDYISKSALIKAIDEQIQGWGKQGLVPSLFSEIAIVQNQPTLSETEIIRKAFERVIQRAEEEYDVMNWDRPWAITINRLKDIIKEECRISE